MESLVAMRTPSPQTHPVQGVESGQDGYITSVQTTFPETNSVKNSRFSSQEVAVFSIGLLILFSVWYLIRQDLRRRKADHNELERTENHLSRAEKLTKHLPCTKCHYFKANMYLPCAVNPVVALKPEAKDCNDFRPREGSQ
jgi:hypothetical protein